MNRDEMLGRALARTDPWDVVVVGGGATGAGVAVDAASRGYSVLLLEQHDFGKGTSSRSTKLVHGGVRYLARGDISLVREALRERGYLRQNAPHLVHSRAFLVPGYSRWTVPYYRLGLGVYGLLSGRWKFGPTHRLSRTDTLNLVPTLKQDGLRGGVVYYDGQFDDARLLVNLVTTAAEQGATVLDYARVTGFTRDSGGRITGVEARDEESGKEFRAAARVVVNATGAFCDGVRRMADSAAARMVSPSQGIHLVFDRAFLPGDTAFVVPKTSDGRVMFAIPWHGHTLIGTTDVAVPDTPLEPVPTEREIEFVLETASRYLQKPPGRSDVLSTFAGIRPLVRADGKNTAALSRDHTIRVDASGLLTITGGKWTTYRNMAEDCVNRAAELGGLPNRPCVTRDAAHSRRAPTRRAVRAACRVRFRCPTHHRIAHAWESWNLTATLRTLTCHTPQPKRFGRHALKWRVRSKMCWHAEHGRCSSTLAPRSRWPQKWLNSWLANWAAISSGKTRR